MQPGLSITRLDNGCYQTPARSRDQGAELAGFQAFASAIGVEELAGSFRSVSPGLGANRKAEPKIFPSGG